MLFKGKKHVIETLRMGRWYKGRLGSRWRG